METQFGERQFEQYFDEMPCYLSVHDPELRIIRGNRRFREDFGNCIGEFCYEVYKGQTEVCHNCPVQATFADGRGHDSEQLLITQHGKQVSVLVHTTPIRDEQGTITAVMEMHTNIGQVKRLQAMLSRSQARYAALFEEAPCFLTVQDPDLVIRHANRAFRETFGPAVGEKCFRVYKHREEPCLVCPARKAFAEGTSQHHEEVVTSNAGEKMNVLCTTTPLLAEDGTPEAIIEMSTDITQIRELQTQLASIGLLVGSIAHGIKGLLTGLDGGIYLVNTGFDKNKPERVEKGWRMVQRNVDRVRSMVMDILYYAKDRELMIESVCPRDLFRDVRADLDKRASDLDVDLELGFDEEAGTLQADAMAVRAMLLNVLENSLDACRSDGVGKRHSVSLDVRREPPHMVFRIADDGVGMDRETREKAFSLFFSSKGGKGTGLGLFISHKIAVKHGGDISLESAPGEGSRFTIRLPLEARPSVPPLEGDVVHGQGQDPGR